MGSGLLLILCFPGWNQGWLAWVAMAPLVVAVWFSAPPATEAPVKTGKLARLKAFFTRHRVGRGAVLGYVAGLVFFWGTFYWLTTVTGPGWFALAFYLALYPAVWGAYLAALRPMAGDFTSSATNLRVATIGAAAWTALEWVRGWLFTGFGWNSLGVAFHNNLSFIQITEYTGVAGLTFLAAFANLILVITIRRFVSEFHLHRFRPHWDFNVTMLLIAGTFIHGVRILLQPPAPDETPLRVAAIQPNIPQIEKFDPQFEQKIFEHLTRLTEFALAAEPQLLIWPEAATPRGMFADETNFLFVRGFATRGDYNFLLGSIDIDPGKRAEFNIAALLNQQGQQIQQYRKIHLVPFGEYVPFRHSFPLFAWMVGDLVPSDFTPGDQFVVMQLRNPDLKAATLICFEDTLGELTRRFVQGGAQFLVNVTNDGWFLESAGSHQHLANAVFRAVENRRPLLRSANTGVTAFVDARGRILHKLTDERGSTFGEGYLVGTVPVPPADSPLTFYTRHGESFAKLCAVLAIVTLPLFRRKAA